MNRDVVRTDDTGLHACDCECVRCDGGYRPTELERAAARRALVVRMAFEAKRKEEQAKAEPTATVRPRLEGPKVVRKPTAEELEAMAEDVQKLRRYPK